MSSQIDGMLDVLAQSPIRRDHQKYEGAFLPEEGKVLTEVREIIEHAKAETGKPVNVVVMGEVKSGKSTFVNTLLRKEVSTVDVLEATAAIHEMTFDSFACFDVNFSDGRVQSFFEENELNEFLKNSPESVLKEILKVQIKLPLEILKKIHVVDTPGLQTITEANKLITEEYMIHADAVLWVINVHHLGQRDVTDGILRFREYGKPIIALINRMDEVEEDLDEVMAYVEEEMGYLFKKIIPMSAQTGWRGVLEENQEKLHSSHVPEVFSYLLEEIADQSEGFMEETLKQTISTQIVREIEIHAHTKKKIDNALKMVKLQLDKADDYNANIKEMMRNKVEGVFETKLLKQEFQEIRNAHSEGTSKQILTRMKEDGVLEEQIQNYYAQLCLKLKEDWADYLHIMVESDEEFTVEPLVHYQNTSEYIFESEGIAVAQKGISRDDTWGISIAAIFGLSALSAVVAPPFIIGSALLGGLYLFKNQDNNHGDLDEQIYIMCKEMREQVKENHMNAFLESLESESNRFCEQLHGIFMHQLLGEELSVQKYQILSSEIDNYILSVEKLSINQ